MSNPYSNVNKDLQEEVVSLLGGGANGSLVTVPSGAASTTVKGEIYKRAAGATIDGFPAFMPEVHDMITSEAVQDLARMLSEADK